MKDDSNAASTAGIAATTARSTSSPFKINLASTASTLAPSTPSSTTPTAASNPAAIVTSACSSAHPSPNGTLTRSPSSIDAMTPRSIKSYGVHHPATPAISDREPVESPFFAGWDETDAQLAGAERQVVDSTALDQGEVEDADGTSDVFGDSSAGPSTREYALASASATSSTTPLYASATSPLFVTATHPSAPSAIARTTTAPLLQIQTGSSTPQPWASGSPSSPLSPLPVNAAPPSAPKLGMLPTPIMSPRGSLPTTPAPSYLRSLSPLAQRADLVGLAASTVMDEQPSIRSLLDIQGKLPLPGQLEDEDVTISSAMLVQATRSDSADSISSVLNDLGHDTTLQHDQAVHHEDEEDTTAGIPMYNGSAFIQDVIAPPLQPLPMSLPVAVERALPMPPAKNASDPPLIPSLRRPDLMHLAGEGSMSQQRPVSPFSPTLPLYSEHVRQASASCDKIILTTAARKETSDPDQDLINFDSDDETSVLPEMHDQYAQYQMEDCSDSVYFSQQSQRQRQYSSSSYGQENDNDAESVSSSNEEEEEEDYSSHALYSTLSTSESPYVRKAWEGSKIVLVPSRHTLPQAFLTSSKQYNANTSLDNPEEWERFTALHALRQQGSTASPETSSMTYIGYGETVDGMRLHARLDSENRQVQVSLRQAELASPTPSPLQTIPSTSASAQAFDEFGMTVHPASQPLSRHAASSSSVSTHSGAIPPHLLVSSPTASIDSGNFPTTPPISSEMSATIPSTSKGSSGGGSTPRIPPAVAFPSVEQQQVPGRQYNQNPLSPTRRLNIVHEKIIYRKRRVKSNISTSAPSALPSPPPMSRNDSSISASSSAAAASQVNSVQQAAERLSKLSTPSMQSISSLASVATTNNGRSVKKKDSKVRLRVPKWLGGRNKDTNTGPLSAGLKITESAPSTPVAPQAENRQAATTTTTIQEEIQLIIEKVRLIQVDSYIVPWPGEEVIISPVTSSRDFRKSLPLSARRSQQTFASGARMHRNSSQPLGSAQSLSFSIHPSQQDATVKERKSFQHPPFSATFAEESNSAIPYERGDDMNAASSVRMSSRHDSNASRSSRVSKRSSSALRMKHTSQASSSQEMTRDFSSDIAYLLDPPKYLDHFAGLFEQSLKLIIRASKDFAERFYYIRGREQEAVSRLRSEVLDEVWQYFADEEAIHGMRHHLFDIFENATMAFAHDYVYTKTIKPSYSHTEMDFGNVINTYRVHTISMADFGISSGYYSEATFAPVVDVLSELCGSGASRQELWEKMPPQSYKRLVQLISQTTDSASTVIALLEAKTPLDTIALLRKAIDELVKATSSSDSGHDDKYSRLATDDLIPLLSWSLVKANAKTLPSLLFYTKIFRLSAHDRSDSEWTIVQFEAAMAFLSTDPLHLVKLNAQTTSPVESHSLSPVQPIFLRTVSEDGLSVPPGRSRRGSIQSLPPESARTISKSPSHQTHLASYHKRTLSSLPSTRMALFQASGRPASIVSAVTTEEDEDNAEMGPPAAPRKDSTNGSADGHQMLSVDPAAAGRDRSISPPIHRPVAVRPPRRPFHVSTDQTIASHQPPSRLPLNRSQTSPLNGTIRPSSITNNRVSVDLQRTGSDGSRRSSVDWWGPLRYAVSATPISPPVGSESAMSSRPESPASPAVKHGDRHGSARSSFDLERSTSDIGWVEWGRRRLSSMTSSTSLVDSAEGGRSVAEQIAEKIAASAARANGVPTTDRRRRKSESAATALSPTSLEEAASEIQAIAAPSVTQPSVASNIGSRTLTSAGSRPRSTLSLSSTSSLDTDASLGRSTNTTSAPVAGRSHFRNSIAGPPSSYSSHSSNLSRSRRFRKELRSANLGPSMALPQLQLDTASASPLNTSFSSGSSSYSHRPSSLHLDTALSSGHMSSGFYPSYSLSHSTSRLGTTPFSPIAEVAPPLQAYSTSPEHVMQMKTSQGEESVPPTPTNFASLTHRPHSESIA